VIVPDALGERYKPQAVRMPATKLTDPIGVYGLGWNVGHNPNQSPPRSRQVQAQAHHQAYVRRQALAKAKSAALRKREAPGWKPCPRDIRTRPEPGWKPCPRDIRTARSSVSTARWYWPARMSTPPRVLSVA
jgi:hypothetical protein